MGYPGSEEKEKNQRKRSRIYKRVALGLIFRKTCGHGHKGQGQRRTKPHPRFEGGQSPIHKRYKKFGLFKSGKALETVNLGKIAYFLKRGWIDPSEKITIKLLIDRGLVSKCKNGVKVLGRVN